MDNNTTPTNPATEAIEVINDQQQFIAAFGATAGGLYCSRKIETPRDKAALYNAINSPEAQLADCINQRIAVADFIVQQVTITKETGEVVSAPRIVLIDTEGHTYSCVSVGIHNALQTICFIFGMPAQWGEDGLPVIVRQINRGSNRILTLDAAV
jgi:hypothetical protein